MVSGTGTLGGRAANLLPVSEDMACISPRNGEKLTGFNNALTVCSLRLGLQLLANLVRMAVSFY